MNNGKKISPAEVDFWLDSEKYGNFLEDGLNSNKSTLAFSIDMVRLSSIRRAISNFVRILTRKSIPVYFNDANAWGTRNVILEKNKIKEFITWDTMYTKESITQVLNENGFKVEEVKTDLVHKNEFTSDDVFFIKARKT